MQLCIKSIPVQWVSSWDIYWDAESRLVIAKSGTRLVSNHHTRSIPPDSSWLGTWTEFCGKLYYPKCSSKQCPRLRVHSRPSWGSQQLLSRWSSQWSCSWGKDYDHGNRLWGWGLGQTESKTHRLGWSEVHRGRYGPITTFWYILEELCHLVASISRCIVYKTHLLWRRSILVFCSLIILFSQIFCFSAIFHICSSLKVPSCGTRYCVCDW